MTRHRTRGDLVEVGQACERRSGVLRRGGACLEESQRHLVADGNLHVWSLETIASAVGEQSDTVEDVYEPFLLQEGFIHRTPRGRVATARAFEHIGLRAPTSSQGFMF